MFGCDVDIDGDTIIVGAYGEDSNGSSPSDNEGNESGAVYLFRGARSGRAVGTGSGRTENEAGERNAQQLHG